VLRTWHPYSVHKLRKAEGIRLRILVLTHEYPPVGGGGGKVAADICQGLVGKKHQVRILTSHIKGFPWKEILEGVEVIRIPAIRTEPFRASLLSMAAYIFFGFIYAMVMIRSWRPDVIHVHFAVPAGALAYIISRITGIPYVLTTHLGDVPGGVPDKTERWFRWIYPFTPPIWENARRVIAVSSYTRELAERYYPVEIEVIHNGIDLTQVDPGTIQLHSPPNIVFAGRLVEQKNPLQLVRTLACMKALPWNCVIIGEGPLRPAMEAEINRHGLDDRIRFTGWITPQDVLEWFRVSDILFMPSRAEGLPVVGVQSLGMGLAIVTSRVGGFVDLVDPGKNGYLFDSDDKDGFCEALDKLLSDPNLLLGFRKASRVKAHEFDLNIIIDSYDAIFSETVSQRVANVA